MSREKNEMEPKIKDTAERPEHTEVRRLSTRDQLTEFLFYSAPGGKVKVECILHDETVWLTQD